MGFTFISPNPGEKQSKAAHFEAFSSWKAPQTRGQVPPRVPAGRAAWGIHSSYRNHSNWLFSVLFTRGSLLMSLIPIALRWFHPATRGYVGEELDVNLWDDEQGLQPWLLFAKSAASSGGATKKGERPGMGFEPCITREGLGTSKNVPQLCTLATQPGRATVANTKDVMLEKMQHSNQPWVWG